MFFTPCGETEVSDMRRAGQAAVAVAAASVVAVNARCPFKS